MEILTDKVLIFIPGYEKLPYGSLLIESMPLVGRVVMRLEKLVIG